MTIDEIIKELKSLANPDNVKGMARFGINPENTFGVTIPNLRSIAKRTGKNHELALQLWNTKKHEARIIAAFIDEYKKVDEQQMEHWVNDFDSWDVCDQVCSNLFDKTPIAYEKAIEWTKREKEFVKRAGFVMMATLAVHDKKEEDEKFMMFLKIIERTADDNRNFVKKAINWALRQIGKRNKNLNKYAIATAEVIKNNGTSAGKWIANDALKELKSESVKLRLNKLPKQL